MPQTRQPGSPAPDLADDGETSPTAYQRALEIGTLDPLQATAINLLVQQAAADAGKRGVVDELGALRIVLTRLVNEQDDLDRLTTNVTRVASVALHAARTQRLITQGAAGAVSGPLALILDEIRRDCLAGNTPALAIPERTPA